MKLKDLLNEELVWLNSYKLHEKQNWENLKIVQKLRNYVIDKYDLYTNAEFENFFIQHSKQMNLPINKLKLAQPSVDSEKIEKFQKTLKNTYPPVLVFKYNNDFYLFNGYHRLVALTLQNINKIKAYVYEIHNQI